MYGIKTTSQFQFGLAVLALLLVPLKVGAEILTSKRGTGDNSATYNHLQATGASWYYTWGTTPSDNTGNFDAEHYPMFWNTPGQSTINTVRNRNPEAILGFNEPERSDQANMSVNQALSSWSTISDSFAGTSTKLISPAVADTVDSESTIGGRTWLSNFMTELNERKTNPQHPNYNPNLRVDAVAFHWYGASTPNNPIDAAYSFLGSVDMYHSEYNLPVYITEFAIHDWGNNYSDAEIIEANRQFLDIVVPALESRSYVEGYAWFHYFNDAPLYSGSPSTPTPMGYEYVGAIGSGQIANIAGQNLGEHAAYLTGGELTMTGGTSGTVRHINALANTSTISGGMNWGLNNSSDWVRIQSGATLRKTGANQISFGPGPISNQGTLEVAQGSLELRASVSGNGNAKITGGTLALTGSGRLNTSPLIDVQNGGTLDVSSVNGTFRVPIGQTLNNHIGGMIVGNVTASVGSIVTGGGTFADNLIAQSGSTLRVGNAGAGVSSRSLIDNFESYPLGDVRTTASPPWTAHENSSRVDIESLSGNQVLSYGQAGFPPQFRGASRSLPDEAVIDNDTTATIFFRFNSETDAPNHSVGIGDQASAGTVDFSDFEVQLRIKQGSSAGTIALDALDGSRFSGTLSSGLTVDTWYNIWMVVDQATDEYDLYMNSGTDSATAGDKLNTTPLSFHNGTAGDLNKFLALAGGAPIDNGVRIDDLIFQPGVDFTNHAAGFNPGTNWTAEMLTVTGDFTQLAGAVLEMDLLDSDNHDVLSVNGIANIAGTLNITFAVGAPIPQAGDAFDLFHFGAASGAFTVLNLPALTTGLAWGTDSLLTTGILEVVSELAGDFNSDGNVNGSDFLFWQRDPNIGNLADWQNDFGSSLAMLDTTQMVVPEPASAILMVLSGIVVCGRQMRSRNQIFKE